MSQSTKHLLEKCGIIVCCNEKSPFPGKWKRGCVYCSCSLKRFADKESMMSVSGSAHFLETLHDREDEYG